MSAAASIESITKATQSEAEVGNFQKRVHQMLEPTSMKEILTIQKGLEAQWVIFARVSHIPSNNSESTLVTPATFEKKIKAAETRICFWHS